MKKTKVRLHQISEPGHLNQMLVGLYELENAGLIELEVIKDIKTHIFVAMLEIEDKKIVIDTMDEKGFYGVDFFDEKEIDFYFKRSYTDEEASKYSFTSYPYGLNYDVYSDNYHKTFPVVKKLKRFINPKKRVKIKEFEAKPIINKESPKICFMTRLWDPNSSEVENEEVRNERIEINKFRTACIKACKEKYGSNFIGGLYEDDFSKKTCPEFILDSHLTDRKVFLDTIKNCDICIATTGLHGSIGWKFAEYVCASRCIVSEPLVYKPSGNFEVNKNYLEFTSSEEIIDAIDSLLNNNEKRQAMMNANKAYYDNFLQPAKLMQRIIEITLNANVKVTV
ncbi:MAG: glycosyltransferase [Sarcina sp.]